MTDDDKSLGDDATLGGEKPERDIDAQSLGDQSTHGDHSQMDSVGDSSSLGDQLTFAGEGAGEAVNDDMEIVDLESRYTIEGVLGKGGMGEVLLATDTRLERKVAIKRILGKLVGSAKAYQRFLTGAQTIAALNHPNIVQLFDFGRDADGPFMILEYVSGGSLLDRCKHGPIPLAEAIDITCQLCDGLAKAHDAGITHRDIKPANVLMTEDRIPKLTDFDLAKGEVADTGMTMAGAVLGTLDFMPPEQRKDATQVDARSDLWSLAATLYQMVTGESPKVIRLKKVPAELQDFLDKALEEKKDDRYQSARAFKDALLASRSGTAEAELEEGDCPHCGTKNPTTRKFCRNPDCSESLEVPCLSCSSKIPMWEQVCDSCGTPQPDLLEQRRSQMASAQAEAESLLKGLDFDRAKRAAVTLGDEPDLRLMHLKGWAERFLGEIEKGREQELARLAELMKEAVTHQQAHDYAAGLRTLGQVPEIVCNTPLPGHDQSVHDLRKKLQSDLDEIKRLDSLIRTRVKNRDLDGLFAEVEQLQRLQPGRDNLQKLAQQLTARVSKLVATRGEALAGAKKRLANQDYDGCLAQLNRIDESLLDADIESLRETAEKNLHQVNALRDAINLAVQGKQLDGLLPQVERCLALQAGAEDLQKLRDQLVERDQKNAVRVSLVIQQAEWMRDARRFDKAVTALGQISEELATQQSKDLLTECENLESLRSGAMQAMERARETGDFKNAVTTLTSYQDALSASGLVDPDVDRATAACQQQLEAQQESERADQRQKELVIAVFSISAGLVVVGFLAWLALKQKQFIEKENSHRATPSAREIPDGSGGEPSHRYGQTQAMQNEAKKKAGIKQSLAKGDYQAALDLDPNNAEALTMKKEADINHALTEGDYQAALDLDPNNAEALTMKKEADINHALTEGDYQAVLQLDPDNAKAQAMQNEAKKKARELQEALAIKHVFNAMQNPTTLTGILGEGSIHSVAFSPDGQQIASCSKGNKTMVLWNVQSGRELFTLSGHTDHVRSVAFSPDGQQIASGSSDRTIKLWDAQSGKELQTLKGHTKGVSSVVFSPDGQRFASGSGYTIKLWDVESGKELNTLSGHAGNVYSVAFSPDGQTIASGSENTIRLWDAQSGKELNTLSGHAGNVYSVAFSPDGKTIASGSRDNTVKLWDIESGKELNTLSGHAGSVRSVAFSPDGKTIASATNYPEPRLTIKLWDVESGKELGTLIGRISSGLISVPFSPDGRTIASGNQKGSGAFQDNSISLWNVGDYLEALDQIKKKLADPSD